MIAWIDLESTGLVAAAAAVLEVAAIVTDDRLQEVARFHRVVHWPRAALLAVGSGTEGIDPAVVELHAKNRLWTESARSEHQLVDVDVQLAAFIAQTAPDLSLNKPQVGGSSIWFDRAIMGVSLPRALEQLHYRSVDVTTLSELARRFWPRLLDEAPRKREIHRALPDIEDSLALCRYFVEHFSPYERTAP